MKQVFKLSLKVFLLTISLGIASCDDETKESLAVLTTVEAYNITADSAETGGNIANVGNPEYTERGVCFATTPHPTVDAGKFVVVKGNGAGEFSATLSNLTQKTTYYVRAYAINAVGVAYGNEIEMTTEENKDFAVLTTVAATETTATSAQTGVNITAIGNPPYTEAGICFSTSPNPTTDSGKITVVSNGAVGAFPVTLSELSQATTYYVRAYAVNAAGIAYGNEISFKTLGLPVLTTSPATYVALFSAVTGGEIVEEGNPAYTERGVCYATSPNPTTDSNKIAIEGNGNGVFSATLTGLNFATTYYVKAYAINPIGTVYGNEISFTTVAEVALETFEDANFRTYLNTFDKDENGSLSEAEILAVTRIVCTSRSIASLNGIEFFKNVTYLSCRDNQITSLDLSQCAKLDTLYCYNNQIVSLNASGLPLKLVSCYNNPITELNVSGCTNLVTLSFNTANFPNNVIESLNIAGTKLTSLSYNGGKLKSLDTSGCTALATLNCYTNQLTSLDITGCTALTSLNCYGNQLTSLNVAGYTALTTLSCYSNQLTSLDVTGCTVLNNIQCLRNKLQKLEGLSSALIQINCSENELTSLDVSQCSLIRLDCSKNPDLATLKIKTGTTFVAGIDYSGTKINSNGDITWVD
ncbi:Internalin-J [termite gut metagenome]|uniref:Internalin-J n=1 Tax=termite gut metagenome TaxID=433724 RepID=A0A5J4RLR0_9ZZZZ